MAHHCLYKDRIEIYYDYEVEKKYLVRVINASWKDKDLDVYAEIEAGSYYENLYFSRNLIYAYGGGGYLVSFPGEKSRSSYYCYQYQTEVTLEDWAISSRCNLRCTNIASYEDERKILEVYPRFKYVLKKIPETDKNLSRIMEILEIWKNHPEIEGLCQLGFYEIATNNNLFKLSLKKRKEIIQWISKNAKLIPNPKFLKLVYIQKMIKNNITYEEFKDYEMHKPFFIEQTRFGRGCHVKWICDYPTFKYLKKKGYKGFIYNRNDNIARLYYDYLKMAERVGHDIKDPYWKYPSDIGKAHAKVMEEMANIQSTLGKLQDEYLKVVMKPMTKFNCNVDGYDIFIPTDIETIKKQCDVLYQCLIRNNYVNKVLMQEEVLVFVWKDGKPVATAEVFYDKKLGQFYGDERGHGYGKSCLPSDEVQNAFNKWLEKFKPTKAIVSKKEKAKKYYKGFHSIDNKGIFHTSFGHFSFEVGKTYATNFLDDEITRLGGDKCVSTDKVFHFCESISEISKHYSPTCYAEIEPLGPVLEFDGALLSNRIKIVKALSMAEVKQIEARENLTI